MHTTHALPRRRHPWRFSRRLTDMLGAKLNPGRHYQFGAGK